MSVEVDPDRPGRIGVGLDERWAPLRIPQVEVEVVHEGRLSAPLHVRVPGLLLALGWPRPPHRRLLLGDADQHHLAVTALVGAGVDQRSGLGLFALTLAEVHHRDPVDLGETVDLFDVAVADLPERRRGRDPEPALPPQEPAHLAHRLQLGHITLQEEAIHRPTGERGVVPQ